MKFRNQKNKLLVTKIKFWLIVINYFIKFNKNLALNNLLIFIILKNNNFSYNYFF